MYELLLGWAAFVGGAVFVLYIRDPYARGLHRSRLDIVVRKVKGGLATMCGQLRERGLCPIG